MDDDGGQGGLEQLGGVVDGVCVQDDQLQRARQLEDPLDLALDLGCGADQNPSFAPANRSVAGIAGGAGPLT